MQFQIIGGLLLIIVMGLLLWRVQYLGNENERLENEINQANLGIEVLDETANKTNELQQKKENAVDKINDAPETDDGDIAPVLRDVLIGLW